MTNRKKRNTLIDIDNVKSDYCCSFVRQCENDIDNLLAEETTVAEIPCLNGKEVKDFYEEVLQLPSCRKTNEEDSINSSELDIEITGSNINCKTRSHTTKTSKNNSKGRRRTNQSDFSSCSNNIKSEIPEVVIDEKLSNDKFSRRKLTARLLTLASQDDVEDLSLFIQSLKDRNDCRKILNGSDQYGWTAVMCAAAQGHLTVVKCLINEGCLFNKDVVENTGKDVFDICKEKKRYEVLDYLSNYNKRKIRNDLDQDEDTNDEIIKCELCSVEYPTSQHKQHIASMMHLFKDGAKPLGMSYQIPDHNKGFQMMLRSGWDKQGLGPEGSGRKNPVKTILKQDRLGLGVKGSSKGRVSHFSAFDDTGVKRIPRLRKTSTVRAYAKKVSKEKAWERNMRHYMSSDF